MKSKIVLLLIGLSLTLAGSVYAKTSDKATDGVIATQLPPLPKDEKQTKAPGSEHEWVAGRWQWQDAKWAWQSGKWIKAPGPHQYWIPGRWENKGENQWAWVKGDWAMALKEAPPAAKKETPPQIKTRGYRSVWVPGHYYVDHHGNYKWRSGYNTRKWYPDHHYNPGRWYVDPHGRYRWSSGHH